MCTPRCPKTAMKQVLHDHDPRPVGAAPRGARGARSLAARAVRPDARGQDLSAQQPQASRSTLYAVKAKAVGDQNCQIIFLCCLLCAESASV